MKSYHQFRYAFIFASLLLLLWSCSLILDTLRTGGEKELPTAVQIASKPGPRVIIFALDGTAPDELMRLIRSGGASNLAELLGKDRGSGLFEHGYAAPRAWSILPSSTIAAWAATFTGVPPAQNGIMGDEWFVRETGTFHAPVPVSAQDTLDVTKVVEDDLIGQLLSAPTLYELTKRKSYVSMLSVHRGATLYTTVAPSSFTNFLSFLIKGTLKGIDAEKSFSAALDDSAVQKLIEAIDTRGLADLQVVYLPGIDIFTHVSENRLESQARYLQYVTDKRIGDVLDAYRKRGALDGTYVIIISDHSQIPTLNDTKHKLGTDDEESPFGLLAKSGFRVRKALLSLGNLDRDYQAVLAYQGFMAYVYLADRSTCLEEHQACDWKKPPRFQEDVLPIVKAFYEANRTGDRVPQLKGTIDLIFSREPVAGTQNAKPFQIFDGQQLVSIGAYLKQHPRPDLIDLERRMQWLGAGPLGNRAGDIVLLARACMNIPIENRYYFAGVTHYTWHGSACEQDSRIPFILAQAGGSGAAMQNLMRKVGGDSPSQMAMTPIVREIFK